LKVDDDHRKHQERGAAGRDLSLEVVHAGHVSVAELDQLLEELADILISHYETGLDCNRSES
jgi:hypothetical protein